LGFGFGIEVITYPILESNIRYVITSKPEPKPSKPRVLDLVYAYVCSYLLLSYQIIEYVCY
jgi:hypothetical protein